MSEYIDLIQKEKQEALLDYNEKAFRLELNRKISKVSKPSRSYVQWFRSPALAGSTVLLVLFFGWLSTKIFLPSSRESDAMLLENTFVQLFTQHGTILDKIHQPLEQYSSESAITEFEWTVKRVIYAIQRENAQDVDISESLSRVLQSAATLINTEINKNDERNI